MEGEPTYIFKNGNVYTLVDGQVVASVKESEWDHMDPMADETPSAAPSCKDCGDGVGPEDAFCAHCGSPVDGGPDDEGGMGSVEMPPPPPEAVDALEEQHDMPGRVKTPNGLTGKVLGRVSGVWGDEVTVRFDNGRIVRLPVDQALTLQAAAEEEKPVSPLDSLSSRLAASFDSSKASLVKRAEELENIKREAAGLIRQGQDFDTEQELDRISVEADYELGEVHAALEHLADADVEAFEAPAPFETRVVEQEHLGGGDSTWLDNTLGEMIAEAESTDYEKLMNEGPEAFVASLEDAAVADAKIARDMASRFINSKTAAASPEVREKYESAWLSRVEECRKEELLNRKEATKKEAAVEEEQQGDLPDDVLFT